MGGSNENGSDPTEAEDALELRILTALQANDQNGYDHPHEIPHSPMEMRSWAESGRIVLGACAGLWVLTR